MRPAGANQRARRINPVWQRMDSRPAGKALSLATSASLAQSTNKLSTRPARAHFGSSSLNSIGIHQKTPFLASNRHFPHDWYAQAAMNTVANIAESILIVVRQARVMPLQKFPGSSKARQRGRLGHHEPENRQESQQRRHAQRHPDPEMSPVGRRQAAVIRQRTGRDVAQAHLQPHHRQPAANRQRIQDQ